MNVKRDFMRIRLTWFVGISLGLFMLVSASAWERTNVSFIGELLFVSAILLVGVAAVGRLWCALYIAGRKQNILVTDGPYSICRNPLYLFSFLGALGIGMGSETCTFPIAIAIGFAIYYPFVILGEERTLLRIHGGTYQQYLDSTPRFFPKISLFIEPTLCSVDPVVFRKHCFSAIWFVFLIGFPESVEALHENHWVPILFFLY